MSDKTIADKMYLKTAKSLAVFNGAAHPGIVAQLPQELISEGEGLVDVVASDHAPHTLEEKAKPYPNSPSGMPGVQTLLPVMLNHVHNGRLSLSRLVDLVCAGPARVYGMARKGRLVLGNDADFTLVDLKREVTLTDAMMKSTCAWTPYDGMKTVGWPVSTIVRGKLVMHEQELVSAATGQLVQFEETIAAQA